MMQKVHFRLTSVAQKRCCLLKLPNVDISDSPDFNQIKSNQIMYLLQKRKRQRLFLSKTLPAIINNFIKRALCTYPLLYGFLHCKLSWIEL